MNLMLASTAPTNQQTVAKVSIRMIMLMVKSDRESQFAIRAFVVDGHEFLKADNATDHQVGAMISSLPKRTARRLWCIRLFVAFLQIGQTARCPFVRRLI